MRFEWDEGKAQINIKKHDVTCDEAKTAFYDISALVIDDPEHSDDEERFILLDMSQNARLLVVCHCLRESETVIRIISARKATKTERNYYGR